jgi:RNA polymerase sigma-70 factor (ECF subfamily)
VDEQTRLARLAAAGDVAARDAFVRAAQPDVWRLCSHLVGRTHADDACQEAMLRILGALPAFRGDASARTWSLAITRYTCADWIRRLSRRRALLGRLRDAWEDDTVPSDTGAVDLDGLLAGLHPERRAAFVLTQLLGLPYAEAAEVCGCPVGTIRSRVARAREQLIGALDADEAGRHPDDAAHG